MFEIIITAFEKLDGTRFKVITSEDFPQFRQEQFAFVVVLIDTSTSYH